MKEPLVRLYWRILYGADIARAALMRVRGLSEEAVVVIGSPRSGTTWLMRLIAERPDYCALFEPLHTRWWPAARGSGFGDRPSEGDDRTRQYMRRILNGTVASRRPRWSPRIEGDVKRLIPGMVQRMWADCLVIKFVRAVRLLPWMVEHFPQQRYIYVARNPYAVVSSQLRTGITGYGDSDLLDKVRQSDRMLTRFYDRIRTDAEQVLDGTVEDRFESVEECLALSWYADNIVAQQIADHEAVLAVKYEDLLQTRDAERRRIQNHIGAAVRPREEGNVRKPQSQLTKWSRHLSGAQVERIRNALRILERAHGPVEVAPLPDRHTESPPQS